MPPQRSVPASAVSLLNRAVSLHQNGRVAEAAPLYERVLRQAPGWPDALNLLGLAKGQMGQADDGIALIRKAVKGDGGNPLYLRNLAHLLDSAGRKAEMATVLVRVMTLTPGDADVACSLGDALYDTGRLPPAAVWYGRAAALRPGWENPLFNRGAVLRDSGRPDEALAAFRLALGAAPLLIQAVEQVIALGFARGHAAVTAAACCRRLVIDPNNADAAKLLGAVQGGAGERWLTRAVTLNPGFDDTLHRLGAMAIAAGRPGNALRRYRRILVMQPDAAAALSGLGVACQRLGQPETAARAVLRAAILQPLDADAALNAGSVLHTLKRLDEALAWHRRALALDPAAAGAWINIANHRVDSAAHEEALAPLDRALALADDPLARSTRGVALMALGRNAEAAAEFGAALERSPRDAVIRSNQLFCLCFDETADLDAVFAAHRRFERYLPPRLAPRYATVDRDPERRLRVGYLSPDFQRYPGPGYHFLLPLIEGHDRAVVSVACYHNDLKEDEASRRFAAAADRWRNVAARSDDELEALIREDGIDILVDCGGHMARNRMPLFARRAAPVQVSLPLYPNTTGLTAMDYQLGDPLFSPPGSERRRSERLIRLPGTVLCYRPAEEPPSMAARERDGFVFGSFNNVMKMNRPTVALWARVLNAAPEARLLLKWRGLDRDGGLARSVRAAFTAQGIAPERLILRGPTPGPYDAFAEIDCALDTVFSNGGTTICDALWMGVPVISLTGEALISRWGATFLHAAGLDALAVESEDAYLAAAVRMVRDPAFRDETLQDLRERVAASPLRQESGYARTVEDGFRQAWRLWCAGERPRDIVVDSRGKASAGVLSQG